MTLGSLQRVGVSTESTANVHRIVLEGPRLSGMLLTDCASLSELYVAEEEDSHKRQV